MRWISLMCLLFAECIGTCKALFVKHSIINQTSIFTSLAHLGVVLALSIIFVNIFPFAIKTYILLNVLALCVLAAIDIIILFFGNSTASKNKKLSQSQSVMNACYNKAQGLVATYGKGDYNKELVNISEMIKYSDNSELTDDEATIMNKLEELETQLKDNADTIPSLITEIEDVIKLRSIKVKSAKRGGY